MIDDSGERERTWIEHEEGVEAAEERDVQKTLIAISHEVAHAALIKSVAELEEADALLAEALELAQKRRAKVLKTAKELESICKKLAAS